jgi:L-aspartate oxidase
MSVSDAQIVDTDVLVIGGGVAGLSSAIAAAERARVLVVVKEAIGVSNTARAQGGVAAVLGDEDTFASHRSDTVIAGAGLCEAPAVEVVVSEGPERIRELIDWGGHFDSSGGKLDLTLEGGHSQKRIVHAHGDRTGREVQDTLIRRTTSAPAITVWERTFAVDLIVADGECRGAIVYRNGQTVIVRAAATIVATGGAGQIYRETTNPPIATGDGFGICLRAGLTLRDMEFVQFHPTTLYVAGSARHLITEAVRGEGACLRDVNGERFMFRYHPSGELAPRDVVSRGIMTQIALTGTSSVFLDLSHLDPGLVRRRFPQIVATCALFKLDATKDQIPVHPSAHYMMGGVECDLSAQTDVRRLMACGEVASSGLHGANRLASNSLLEGLVFGRRAGLRALEQPPLSRDLAVDRQTPDIESQEINIPDMMNSIRSLMWRDVGVIRSAASLQRAVQRLRDWSSYVLQARFTDPTGWELVNTLMCSLSIAASALWRHESRGAHFRTDHPQSDDARWLRHSSYALAQESK